MDETMKGVLRWVAAAAGMLLVVFVTVPLAWDAVTSSVRFGDEDGPAAMPEETEAPEATDDLIAVENGTAPAIGDVSIRNGAVRQAGEAFVAIGGVEGDAVVLAFEQFAGSDQCIDRVEVLFTTPQALPPTDLLMAPATVTNVPDLADGDAVPDPAYVEDGPEVEVTVDEDIQDEYRVRVTDLYRAWIGGQVTDEADAPFTVTLRPPDTLGDRRIQVASSGSDSPPRLSWSGVDGCGTPPATG